MNPLELIRDHLKERGYCHIEYYGDYLINPYALHGLLKIGPHNIFVYHDLTIFGWGPNTTSRIRAITNLNEPDSLEKIETWIHSN